jgi:putative molybdopterin biosynthesis protein
MGMYASAKALELDFIPITKEQYDLVIPSPFLEMSSIQILLDTIRSSEFRKQVKILGGYDPKNSGHIIMEID